MWSLLSKTDFSKNYKSGEIYEFTEERVNELIEKGIVEKLKAGRPAKEIKE